MKKTILIVLVILAAAMAVYLYNDRIQSFFSGDKLASSSLDAETATSTFTPSPAATVNLSAKVRETITRHGSSNTGKHKALKELFDQLAEEL